mmetsp:Transcript_19402/g.34930  ORF Transcript_19402/g.34930 Transcript_19402/m.34930 type:complete len:368 (+) Transcript_19402:192-1295(+)
MASIVSNVVGGDVPLASLAAEAAETAETVTSRIQQVREAVATSSSSSSSSMEQEPLCSVTAAFAKTIALNNAGAQHMERGDHESGIKALTASFLQFKKTYSQQKMNLGSLRTRLQQQACSPSAFGSLNCPVIFNVDELFSWKTFASDPFNDDREQETPSVYSNPIFLPPDFPITQESCGFLSTSITLNLAIAHHSLGLELQQQQQGPPESTIQNHLTSAGRYYEYTIRLERARQQEEQQRIVAAAAALAVAQQQLTTTAAAAAACLSLPPLFVTPLALLVILNNLGQLHYALDNKDRGQKCYRQLQSTVMFLLLSKNKSGNADDHADSHHASSSSSTHRGSKDLQVFMENAVLGLQTMTTRATAPAA